VGLRAKRLKGLSIGETSGVDHPAHLAEGWMVLKAAEDGDITVLGDEDDTDDGVAKAFTPAMVAGMLRSAMSSLPADAKAHAKALLAALKTTPAKKGAGMADDKDDDASDLATWKARAEKAEADLAAARVVDPAGQSDEAALAKALGDLPEPLRKAWEANAAKATKAEADAAEAEKVAKAERDARLEAEYVAKARTDYGHLPIKAEALAPILRAIDEGRPLTDEQRAEHTRVFRAANEQVRSGGVLRSIGSGHGGDGDGSAYSEIVAKATELQTAAAGAGSDMTREQAIAKAKELHPDLALRHRDEMRNSASA
jgi:hypothetical protein